MGTNSIVDHGISIYTGFYNRGTEPYSHMEIWQPDKDGNFIVLDGRQWQGMVNDTRVEQVDLGAAGVNFDFTLNTNTGDQNKAALITVMDFLYISNNCTKDATIYVSREIARNWERKFSTAYDGDSIIEQLAKLQGVAAIKVLASIEARRGKGWNRRQIFRRLFFRR